MKRGEVLLAVSLMFILLISTSLVSGATSISSCTELQNIKNDLDGNYELTGDIDCSGYSFTPIGDTAFNTFKGILDGKNKVIRNLRIDSPAENNIGIFKKNNGIIKNLGLENVYMRGYQFVGSFAGSSFSGKIINCYSTGTVKAELAEAGGLMGEASGFGSISRSYSTASVESKSFVGGLVGSNAVDIDNSYARGSVTAGGTSGNYAGGLVGTFFPTKTITNSYSTGSVKCSRVDAGGNPVLIYTSYCGGLTENFTPGTCVNSFYDTASGFSGSKCGTSKSTALMKTSSTFTGAGWNFDNIWDIDPLINDGYPFLRKCPSGMVSYWTFDSYDVSGVGVFDIVEDKEGINNGATSAAGQVRQAFNFSTDYVSLPASNYIITNPSSWTIVSWFNADTISAETEHKGNRIITFLRDPTRTSLSLLVGENNKAKLEYCERDGGGGHACGGKYDNNILNISNISTGNWYFFVATYDGSELKAYINGSLKQTISNPGILNPSSSNAMIGRGRDSGIEYYYFDGKIDEVAIFNRPLTAAEVSELYAKSLAGKGYCEDVAVPVPTCSDGILNGAETGVDCGGSCPACVAPTLPSCTNNDIIMRLYSPSNSHGALWNQSYDYKVCCSEIFGAGNPACSVTSPHDCKTAGSNKVLELYQQNNSHAQVKGGPLTYPFDVCYGDLSCRAVKDPAICEADEKVVVRLYQENNSHISNASDTRYPIKICCKPGAVAPPAGNACWANMRDMPINKADKNDSVKLIVKDIGFSEQEVNFTIYQVGSSFRKFLSTITFGLISADRLVAGGITGMGYATWTAETGENYYFKATLKNDGSIKIDSSEVGGACGYLNVSSVEINSPPHAEIIYPVKTLPLEQRRFKINKEINFTQSSWDEDDELDVEWDFNEEATKNCTWPRGNCNTTYSFSSSGTKVVELKVKEKTRWQEARDKTEVYIYDAGINVFAIISNPHFDEIFDNGNIFFNASRSYIANCSYGSCPVASCYRVDELYCYDLPKSLIPSAYELWLNWTFSKGGDKGGNWSSGYGNVVEFQREFRQLGEQRADLILSYVQSGSSLTWKNNTFTKFKIYAVDNVTCDKNEETGEYFWVDLSGGSLSVTPSENDCYRENGMNERGYPLKECCPESKATCNRDTRECEEGYPTESCADHSTKDACERFHPATAIENVAGWTGPLGILHYCEQSQRFKNASGADCFWYIDKCMCVWNPSNNTCGPRYTVSENCDNSNDLGECELVTMQKQDKCKETGFVTYAWAPRWSGPDVLKPDFCKAGTRTFKCSARLLFFTISGFIISVIVVIIIYAFIIKKNKLLKLKEIKKRGK